MGKLSLLDPQPPSPLSYCQYWLARPIHQQYHDTEYGFPISGDNALLERLALEIGQAGLSWETILRKKDGYRRAFEGFDLDRVAAYGEEEEARLLTDAGIVRNRLKVRAVIENARRLLDIREQHIFFVATAPLSEEGHINCSPKGGDSFRVLGPLEVAYQNYTGSGAETAARLRENGRILLMFCAFQGKPDIVH